MRRTVAACAVGATLAGLLTPIAAVATGVVFLRWLLAAREMVAAESHTVPSRPPWAVVLGAVLPPATLTVPGSTLAELEHVASGRPAPRYASVGTLFVNTFRHVNR